MSSVPNGEESEVARRVPLADLSVVDKALRLGPEAIAAAVKKVRPADLGHDLSRRSLSDGAMIVEASDDRRAAAILRSAHPSVAAAILTRCDPSHAARLLAFLPTEPRTTILALSPELTRNRLEEALSPSDRDFAERLLKLPEASVGRLMTPKIWRCRREDTAGAALAALRDLASDIEVAQNCYVVDDHVLVGVVPLRELAVAPLDARVDEMMTPDPISVRDDADRADAADIIQTHDFLSLPVTDSAGHLIGAVRVDDLLDATLEGANAGVLNQGAVTSKIAARLPYFQTSLASVVRSRITWLILLFVAETLTGTVLRTFEDELARVVALSFFVPLLIGTGGNAGSQSVSTIIRALAVGEVRDSDIVRVVTKEVITGMVLGLLLGVIAFGRALLWGVGGELAACVAVTIFVVCTWANAVGAAVPLVAQRLRIDPTVVSAPLITTVVDASGLFIYFSFARLMIAQLH